LKEFFNLCKFGIIGKILVSGTVWNKKIFKKTPKTKMKMKKKKNEDLVEKCYNFHFHWRDSLIPGDHHCEEISLKYSFNIKL